MTNVSKEATKVSLGNAGVGRKAHTTVAENAAVFGDGDITSAKEWGRELSLTLKKERPIRT